MAGTLQVPLRKRSFFFLNPSFENLGLKVVPPAERAGGRRADTVKAWFFGPGFFLFYNAENYNATQPFVVKDLVISGFRKCSCEELLLEGVLMIPNH